MNLFSRLEVLNRFDTSDGFFCPMERCIDVPSEWHTLRKGGEEKASDFRSENSSGRNDAEFSGSEMLLRRIRIPYGHINFKYLCVNKRGDKSYVARKNAK